MPAPSEITVRPARPDDEPPLAHIDRATWDATVSPAPPAPAGSPFFSDDHPPTAHLVAEFDGEVVGYVRIGHPTELESSRHVVFIAGLAVDPAVQGRGVGRRLVEAAVAVARHDGARKVSLRVLAPNAGARRLYERCGFVVEGTLRDEFLLGGEYVDDLFLARYLDE